MRLNHKTGTLKNSADITSDYVYVKHKLISGLDLNANP